MMIGHVPRAKRRTLREAGFSLMEMLVALVILALVLALLPGAFRLARQVWSATAVLDRESGRDFGFEFLETRLAEAMPLYEPTKAGLVAIVFSGTNESLRFVAPSQNGPVGGGLYSYSFEIRPQETGGLSSLVVTITPYSGPRPEGSNPLPPAEEQVLADDVTSAEFRYFGRHTMRGAASWQTEWKRTNALPDLVELSISRSHGGRVTSRSIVTELRLRNSS
jgi:general secretion pathway protein J